MRFQHETELAFSGAVVSVGTLGTVFTAFHIDHAEAQAGIGDRKLMAPPTVKGP